MKSGRWRNVLCIQNSILIQYIMDEKENIFVSNEIIRLWYKDWSGTVKFIHSFIIFIITILFCSIDLYSSYKKNNKTLWFVDFSSI